MKCLECKFYKDVEHGHGEPAGRCALKTHLMYLLKKEGKEIPVFFNAAGPFQQHCDFLIVDKCTWNFKEDGELVEVPAEYTFILRH